MQLKNRLHKSRQLEEKDSDQNSPKEEKEEKEEEKTLDQNIEEDEEDEEKDSETSNTITEIEGVIEKLSNNMKNEFHEIKEEMGKLKMVIMRLSDEIKKIKIASNPESSIIELKRESLKINPEKVKYALSFKDVRGDVLLFKDYYLERGFKAIRRISPRKFEYFFNGKWNTDNDGIKLMQIVPVNIQQEYYRINRIENYSLDGYSLKGYSLDEFQSNQVHIQELGTEKYKKQLMRTIAQELANDY